MPLSLLTSEGFTECPLRFTQQADIPEFEDFFIRRQVTGIVNPETLEEILCSMGISSIELNETLGLTVPPLLNRKIPIHCLLDQSCLERAIDTLGSNFECTVQIFCIRPVSHRYNDGEIYQQVSRHMRTSRLGLADQWLDHLGGGKRKHLAALLGHPKVMEAMDTALPFTGLWEEFLLGNWAKHLAAHCDEFIKNYWVHIGRTWSVIFDRLQHLRHLVDAQTVLHLRYKAPAWSARDRDEIEEGFDEGILFPRIQGDKARARLKKNILSLQCTVPSIRTFDENMRYFTIPAKIIERLVEVKPVRKRKRDNASKCPESLFDNLKKDWQSTGGLCEVNESRFHEIKDKGSPEFSFLQLFLAAWRNFPNLSNETPLQDVKGIGMVAFLNEEEGARLCQTAYVLGFINHKTQAAVARRLSINSRKTKFLEKKTSEWRGEHGHGI
ncbi:unnamed protein product [Fusarium graminearum]|nr:unnamed protein product [Fusarium graminearum]